MAHILTKFDRFPDWSRDIIDTYSSAFRYCVEVVNQVKYWCLTLILVVVVWRILWQSLHSPIDVAPTVDCLEWAPTSYDCVCDPLNQGTSTHGQRSYSGTRSIGKWSARYLNVAHEPMPASKIPKECFKVFISYRMNVSVKWRVKRRLCFPISELIKCLDC